MVRLIQPQECDCKTCEGGIPVPLGVFGGSYCLCRCHEKQREAKLKMTPNNPKGLLNRQLENPEYRKRHELGMISLKVEAAILLELERRNWTYEKLAKLLGTNKSNISRDLNGGLKSATISRLKRYADALEMTLNIEMYRKAL